MESKIIYYNGRQFAIANTTYSEVISTAIEDYKKNGYEKMEDYRKENLFTDLCKLFNCQGGVLWELLTKFDNMPKKYVPTKSKYTPFCERIEQM